jgi:type I restriction enzyme S subunit
MASDVEPSLPPGWTWASLGELGKTAGGGTPPKSNPAYWTNGRIPWISPKDMKADVVGDVPDKITRIALDNSAAKLIPAGSLLMVIRSGILNHTFPVAISDRAAAVNQDLKTLTVHAGICPWYIKRFLEHRNREIVHNLVKDGTTVASVDVDRLFALRLPIAPSGEQERITAIIDELFGEIEAGEQELQRACEGLAAYRRAVLKAAVTGELTRECREADAPNMTGHELLAFLRSELITRRANDGDGLLQSFERLILPASWSLARLDECGEIVTGNTPSTADRSLYGGKLAFLKPTDLDSGFYVTGGRETLSAAGARVARIAPANATLVTCIGATVGKTGFTHIEAAFNQQINAILPHNSVVPEWLYLCLVSPYGRAAVIDNASATTLPILNKSRFSAIRVPLPSAVEQAEAVRLTLRLLEAADEAEKDIEYQHRQSERVRQSILSAAFSGRLVTQNPSEEPAAVFLERLRHDRDMVPSKGERRRFRSTKPVLRGFEVGSVPK